MAAVTPEPVGPARLAEGGTGMVYAPELRRITPHRFEILASRDDSTVIPWGFWGGVLSLAAGVVAIAFVGAVGLWSVWNAVWPLAVMALGLALLKFGRRNSLTRFGLGRVELDRGVLLLGARGEGEALPFDTITEIVFGMTRYALAPDDPKVKVQAYALLVRTTDETLMPVVEASPDKEAVYGLARFLSQVVEAPLSQVGLGVK